MNDHNLRLRQLTDDLLSLDHPGQMRDASIELHALCSELAGLSDETLDPLDTTPTLVAVGLAISALNLALDRFSARPLEILCAGCGPFATLAIPLMTRFRADEVRFTLLDIHQRSLDAARRLVRGFGFEAWVREFVEADASAYRHPLHIVITETMQRALTKEPQVAVTLYLAPQLCPGGILIPERITVDACLRNPATEFQLVPGGEPTPPLERVRVTLGRLPDLSLESVPRWRSEGLPEVSVAWPEAGSQRLQLMLRTQVTVFGSFTLGDCDAGITCPHHDREFNRLEPGSTHRFQYQMGEEPGFRMRPAG